MAADDFALHRALHVGDFFGALVDQENDQHDFRMVGGDRVSNGLQEHRFTGAGRRDDEAALALADGGEHVHDATGEVIAGGLELQALLRIERREVVEEDLVTRLFRRLVVDGVDFDEGEVAFAFFGGADLAGDGVAGAQVEAADLRGRDVDVVRAGQVVVLGGAEEAETVGQAFEDALREDEAALFGLRLEDLEDELLFAQAGGAHDAHAFGDVVEPLDGHVFELDEVEGGLAVPVFGGVAAGDGAGVVVFGRSRRGFRGGGRRRSGGLHRWFGLGRVGRGR